MAEGTWGDLIALLTFDGTRGFWPKIRHVTGNIYAIAYHGPDDDGYLKTLTISDAGAMALIGGGVLEFEPEFCYDPDLIQISGEVFAVVYRGPADDGFLKTVTISDAGAIAAIDGGSLEFDSTFAGKPRIIHVSNTTYVVAYRGPDEDGWMKTVTISDSGIPALVDGGSLEFDNVHGDEPRMVHVSGYIYAVAYSGNDWDGTVKTVTISEAGAIAAVSGGSLVFESYRAYQPYIIHISGSVFAIAYGYSTARGRIKTITISAAGAIALVDGGFLEYSDAQGVEPIIKHVSGSVYAIAYKGPTNHGWGKSFTITNAGAISFADSTGKDWGSDIGQNPSMIHITGSVYAIAFRGTGNLGKIRTLNIETIISKHIDMLMMMGIG